MVLKRNGPRRLVKAASKNALGYLKKRKSYCPISFQAVKLPADTWEAIEAVAPQLADALTRCGVDSILGWVVCEGRLGEHGGVTNVLPIFAI
jgi:hypothetical protein